MDGSTRRCHSPAVTAATAIPVPGGLVLRPAQPSDLDQIGALLVDRGEPDDALDHRLVVQDPDAGWSSCAVVVDGDRVVCTATLLDEEVRIGDVRLPTGQVELVASDRAYEGRGLVRALMRWAHDRSAARGHVIGLMVGIPYFYRLFGYEYAIDVPQTLTMRATPPGEGTLRAATPADIPAMTALHEAAQRGFDVAMPHSAPCWRWLLAHEASTVHVLERDGTVVATGRTTVGDEVLLAEAAALDEPAARDLLRGAAALGPKVRVVHRPGTVTAAAWQEYLDHEPRTRADQYYVRIPDVAALLDRLRPLLWQRLDAAGIDRDDIVISTFGAHYRIPKQGNVVTGGPMQAPATVGGAGVAPDHLAALLFGPLGIKGLTQLRPDVYAGDEALFEALFPPLKADVLTYYLPY
jgi:predicted N-acetyltransferase YhbS